MRWLADECVATSLVRGLRASGHDVAYVREQVRGIDDLAVLQQAVRERRVVLSEDKDHGELIFGGNMIDPPGVVLIRIPDERLSLILPRLEEAAARFGDGLHDLYVVLEENRFRIRQLRAR